MGGRSFSNAGPDFKRITRNLGTAVDKGNNATVSKAAAKAKRVHESEIAKVAGSDMRLSGVGRAKGRTGGAKIGVRYKVSTRAGHAQAFMSASGPLPLIENDTPGRVIRSAYTKGTRRRGLIGPAAPRAFTGGGKQAVLNIPGIGFRNNVRHPGTKGQEPWRKSVKIVKPIITKELRSNTTDILKKAAGL